MAPLPVILEKLKIETGKGVAAEDPFKVDNRSQTSYIVDLKSPTPLGEISMNQANISI